MTDNLITKEFNEEMNKETKKCFENIYNDINNIKSLREELIKDNEEIKKDFEKIYNNIDNIENIFEKLKEFNERLNDNLTKQQQLFKTYLDIY
jgi:DNA repair exonuclease SbcCD ATPase subunit